MRSDKLANGAVTVVHCLLSQIQRALKLLEITHANNDLRAFGANDITEDLADSSGVGEDTAGDYDFQSGAANPKTPYHDLSDASEFYSSRGKNLRGECVSTLGGSRHDGKSSAKLGTCS